MLESVIYSLAMVKAIAERPLETCLNGGGTMFGQLHIPILLSPQPQSLLWELT